MVSQFLQWLLLCHFIFLSFAQQLKLTEKITVDNWLDKFYFYTSTDSFDETARESTHLVNTTTALLNGYVKNNPHDFEFGADQRPYAPNGRDTVTLMSRSPFSAGLVIIEIDHLPERSCTGRHRLFLNNQQVAFQLFDIQGPFRWAESVVWVVDQQMRLNLGEHSLFSFESVIDDEPSEPAPTGAIYAIYWNESTIKLWTLPLHNSPSNSSRFGDTIDLSTLSAFPHDEINDRMDTPYLQRWPDLTQKMNLVFENSFCGVPVNKQYMLDASCRRLASSCRQAVTEGREDYKRIFWNIRSITKYSEV